MITKRVIVIIKNVITLIHYGIKYLAIRALEVLHDSDTLHSLHPDTLHPDTLRNRSTSKRSTSKRSISKEYHNSFKKSLDYLDKPRYISADYEDNMEYYDTSHLNTSHARDTFDRDTSNKWDKKTAPYCETP